MTATITVSFPERTRYRRCFEAEPDARPEELLDKWASILGISGYALRIVPQKPAAGRWYVDLLAGEFEVGEGPIRLAREW